MLNDDNLAAIGQQHKQTWERLFSILSSAKSVGRDSCHRLAQLPAEQREAFIEELWGRTALDRVKPMLLQIKTIEEQANRLSNQ